MPKTVTIPSPDKAPYFGWTEESTKQYFEDVGVRAGDRLIIFNGQAGMHEYRIAVVEEPASGSQRRIIVNIGAAWGGRSFYRSGRNCWSPRGQSRLLPPVPELMKLFVGDTDTVHVSTSIG